MTDQILLSIVVVSFNTKDVLRECLARVDKYSQGIETEVLVVDNNSSDGSVEMISTEFPDFKLIANSENLGFAAGNNVALRIAKGRYVLLLNSDAYLLDDTLEKTLKYMENNPECGILGVKLISEDGSMQPSARNLPDPLSKFLVMSGLSDRYPGSRFFGSPDYKWWNHQEVKEVGWVPGAYFLIRKDVINEIGLLDERYFMYFEEIDYCLHAARSDWKVVFYPDARVIHLGGQSSARTKKRITISGKQLINFRVASEFRYYRKNYGLLTLCLSAGVEILWRTIVLIRNIMSDDMDSVTKKEESTAFLSTIFKTLYTDRLGKGKI